MDLIKDFENYLRCISFYTKVWLYPSEVSEHLLDLANQTRDLLLLLVSQNETDLSQNETYSQKKKQKNIIKTS